MGHVTFFSTFSAFGASQVNEEDKSGSTLSITPESVCETPGQNSSENPEQNHPSDNSDQNSAAEKTEEDQKEQKVTEKEEAAKNEPLNIKS